VNLFYADTSALVRAYLADEADHAHLKAVLLHGGHAVVTSEIAWVEFTSAVTAAGRAGRLAKPQVILRRFDADCGPAGPIALLRLELSRLLALGRDLIHAHGLRTPAAVHLAVARTDGVQLASGGTVTFVTRDQVQRGAAQARGLGTA
jgi:uncharacterized protein